MIKGHANLLYESSLNAIIGDLSTWRVDSFIRQLEKQKSKGRILPFVRGLRLSALLIYEIREILSTRGLTADWGHILDDTGTLVSSEADIIIHTGGHFKIWNGKTDAVMNFKFIEKMNAKMVISCKSFIRKYDIDRKYCNDMKKYVDKIWLFVECCGPRSAKNIAIEALKYGYDKFWYLYTWSKNNDINNNTVGWQMFIEELKKL